MHGVGGKLTVVGDHDLSDLPLPPHQDLHQVVIEDVRVQVDISKVTVTVTMIVVTMTQILHRSMRRISTQDDAHPNTLIILDFVFPVQRYGVLN